MTPAAVEALEQWLRLRNRLLRIGRYSDPSRYFGPGGVDEAERLCAEANADLLAFVRPPSSVAVERLAAYAQPSRPGRRVTTVYRFDSPRPSGRQPNDRVELRLVGAPSRSGDRKALVFHHPMYQRRWQLWEWFLETIAARHPVAMLAAPYHFGRTPPGEFAGEGSVNPNPWRLFEALRQWSWDQTAALSVLREAAGLEPAAVIGFSLGGFQTILASAAGSLDLPVVAVASTNRYAHGIFNGVLADGLRKGFAEAGIDSDRLRRMIASLELERYAPALRDRPVLFIAGRFDRVDPAPSGRRLEEALRPTRSVWLDAGHGTVLLQRRRVNEEILRFLSECGIETAAGEADRASR